MYVFKSSLFLGILVSLPRHAILPAINMSPRYSSWFILICQLLGACSVASVVSDSLWPPPPKPGSYVHEIFLARILGWVAISSSRRSSQSRDWTHVLCVSCIVADSLPLTTGETLKMIYSEIWVELTSCFIFYPNLSWSTSQKSNLKSSP